MVNEVDNNVNNLSDSSKKVALTTEEIADSLLSKVLLEMGEDDEGADQDSLLLDEE